MAVIDGDVFRELGEVDNLYKLPLCIEDFVACVRDGDLRHRTACKVCGLIPTLEDVSVSSRFDQFKTSAFEIIGRILFRHCAAVLVVCDCTHVVRDNVDLFECERFFAIFIA